MPEFFSSDGPYYLQFLVIFLVILVLLMGIVLLFRRVAGRGLSLSARAGGNRARQPRLGIVDIYELDRQRQLILLRRDNVEHLLLVGGPNDVVVERNVIRGAGSRLPGESLMRPDPASDMSAEPGAAADQATLGPQSFEMPMVVPPPISAGNGNGSRAAPLDPSLFDPEAQPSDRTAVEPVKARVGISQVGRILRRTPPPLVDPRPDVASERVKPAPAATPEPAPAAVESPVPPSLMTSGTPRPVDPEVLSDMARQLETALRRQSSAVTPPPVQAPTFISPPPPPAAPSAAAAAEPASSMGTAWPNPSFLTAHADPAPPPPALEPEPAPEPPLQPERRPDPASADTPAPPQPAPEQKPGGTPFTVEEIETEFARLLGRPIDRKS